MPRLSETSVRRLGTCDKRLIALFSSVIREVDCAIICGTRGQEEQDAAFAAGNSQVKWPNSKHNREPSLAVDVAFYPIEWDNIEKFEQFARVVKRHAEGLGIEVRWGGDWSGWKDRPHWEVPEC